jgi:hypothetical protein
MSATKNDLMRMIRTMASVGCVFGLIAVIAAGAAPAAADNDQSFAGSYTREFTGAGGKVSETLEIKADKSASWTTNYPGKPAQTQTGIWNARGTTLIVLLNKRDGEAMPAEERIIFDLKGKNLKGRNFDKNVHGNGEMVFHRHDQ